MIYRLSGLEAPAESGIEAPAFYGELARILDDLPPERRSRRRVDRSHPRRCAGRAGRRRAGPVAAAEGGQAALGQGAAAPQEPLALIAHAPKDDTLYVPATVRLRPDANGRLFGLHVEGVASERRRESAPMQHLMRRFIGAASPSAAASAAARMERYLADETATVASVPLEEGVDGKAIVKLSNGAVAMWKPSAAEYPELMRARIERGDPDWLEARLRCPQTPRARRVDVYRCLRSGLRHRLRTELGIGSSRA